MSEEAHKRTEAVAIAGFLASNHEHIDYEFGGGLEYLDLSPTELHKRFAAGGKISGDCRFSIDYIAKWSGWKPFGRYGYEADSEDMWEVLPHIPEAHTHPGSLVTYGDEGDDHVCMIVRPDWVFSFGQAYDAHIIPLENETAAHPGQPVTFLSIMDLIS